MSRTPRPRAADRITQLRQEIREHNRRYYVDGNPTITDAEFDRLFRELQEMEAANPGLYDANSPTQCVGGEPVEGLTRVQHTVPMLSIANSMTIEELDAFHNRVRQALGDVPIKYAVDWKVDGCAVSLRYERGNLVQAVTRGSGTQGDDITHNARTFRGLPLTINSVMGEFNVQMPEILEVRGEAFMTYSDFADFKAAEEAAGNESPSNPRNTTSGAIRALDPEECRRRKIRFVAHGAGHCIPLTVQGASHGVFMTMLTMMGMPCVRGKDDLTYAQVKDEIEKMIEALPQLDMPIDGIVVKVDERSHQMLLGATDHHPHWCTAYKWERYESLTYVNDITIQVGKSGALTPVAELEPVAVGEEGDQTTVSRASLFNKAEIERLDIRVGDKVVVEKAGKIIPHIVSVDKAARGMPRDVGDGDPQPTDPQPFEFPMVCPECDSVAVQDEDGVAIRCTNTTSCKAQLAAAVEHFASRKCMDIRGLGPTVIAELVQWDTFNSVADLYKLHEDPDKLLEIPKVGKGKRDKLLAAIETSKEKPLENWLAGLNVRHLGSTAAGLLTRRLGTLWDILAAEDAALTALPGLGQAFLTSWNAFIDSDHGRQLIAGLVDAGLDCGQPVQEGEAGCFADMTIVPTGAFERYDREEIKDVIRRNGGKASSSVSKNTTFIVAGRAPGAKKLQKAESLGTEIIDEAEFRRRLGATDEPLAEPPPPRPQPAAQLFE